MTTLPEANAKFAVELFGQVTKEHPGNNLLISPVNATRALGLLALASGCEQAADIEKVLHWDEVKECGASRYRRYLGGVRSFARSAISLKEQAKGEVCPKQKPAPAPVRTCQQPTCPKPRPCPEPTRPEPCPKQRQRPEPPCPRPRPCPEPEQPPCPERCVPEYDCENPKGVHTAFSKILATLHAPSTNYTLSFANKLYGDHAIDFIEKFIYCALKLYWTEVAGAEIHNAPEEVRRIINLWVEVQTHGKIKGLLPKDSFDCLAHLLHINALYFKGKWLVKFDKELTEESPFYAHHADVKECQTVLLMNRKGIYNTGIVDICGVEVQLLEVPFENNELTLLVLLPTDCSPEALEQLEDSLTHEHLLDWSCQLKPAEVDVFLPKFKLERSIHIIDYVDLPKIQDPTTADFSQATTTEGVALTQLVHDTFIEIDEEGGEEPQPPRCPRRQHRLEPVEFVANHPFLFSIRHNCTQSIIALGRFAKPE